MTNGLLMVRATQARSTPAGWSTRKRR